MRPALRPTAVISNSRPTPPSPRHAAPCGRPGAIVARTLKGQGVSFMAGDNRWHYTKVSDEIYARALAELS